MISPAGPRGSSPANIHRAIVGSSQMIRVFMTILLGGILSATRGGAAEPLVIDLWPDKPPGDVGIAAPEQSRIHQSKIVGPTKLITNVSKPTLAIYSPWKERNNGTAMIICPGGGYWNLYWELEGEEVAAWLNSLGMTGIILKYRVPRRAGEVRAEPPPGPLLDAQRAISIVRARAAEWGIDSGRIGMIGFSAGGHLAVAAATSFEQRTYAAVDAFDQASCRPDFAIGCYSGYLKAKDRDEIPSTIRIPAGTPPVFLAHASDDTSAIGGSNPDNSAIMYIALQRAGVPVELHIFGNGNHDFGVRKDTKLAASWTELCVKWLRNYQLLRD
jgi:acetyl esterase/lipase